LTRVTEVRREGSEAGSLAVLESLPLTESFRRWKSQPMSFSDIAFATKDRIERAAIATLKTMSRRRCAVMIFFHQLTRARTSSSEPNDKKK